MTNHLDQTGLCKRFTDTRGRGPSVVAQAPGRINIIGDHIDYAGGLVLPIAINRTCIAVADQGGQPNRARFESLDLNDSIEIDLTQPITPDAHPAQSWAAYPLGVLSEFMDTLCPSLLSRIDVLLSSSVPFGSGLSSSAAIEVAIATLIEHILALELDPMDTARLAQRAEHRFAHVPCGLMDQVASTLAQPGHALLFDCRSETAEQIQLPPEHQVAFFVIDTRVRHALATTAYADRRSACELAARSLGLSSLRDLESDQAEAIRSLPDEQQRAARHVVSEIRRTRLAAKALRSGALDDLGPLMADSHRSLSEGIRVSCPELDAVVLAAQSLPETIGARMTGGGFGGSAIALVKPDSAHDFPERLQKAIGPALSPDAFRVWPSRGARARSISPERD